MVASSPRTGPSRWPPSVAARMRSRDWSEPAPQDFIARGEGMGLTVSQWVTAALYNGLARYEDAFAAAAQAAAGST